MWTEILNSRKNGGLFKGHSLTMVRTEKDLTLSQSYFNTIIHNTYSIEKNKTDIECTYYPFNKIPKWFKEIGVLAINSELPGLWRLKCIDSTKDLEYNVTISAGSQAWISWKKTFNSLCFSTQVQNISFSKDLRRKWSVVLNNIKSLSIEDLKSFEIYENEVDSSRHIILPEALFY